MKMRFGLMSLVLSLFLLIPSTGCGFDEDDYEGIADIVEEIGDARDDDCWDCDDDWYYYDPYYYEDWYYFDFWYNDCYWC